MKTINEFLKDIESGDLKEAFVKLAQDKDGVSAKERTDLIIGFAKENGYEISAEDLAMVEADKKTLDDEELNRMAAGGLTGNVSAREGCVFDYACYTTWNSCVVSEECALGASCVGNLSF